MPSALFCRAFRLSRERGVGGFGLPREGAGKGSVFYEDLGLLSPSSSCPKHLLGWDPGKERCLRAGGGSQLEVRLDEVTFSSGDSTGNN